MALHTWSAGEEILASHLNDSFTAKQDNLTFGIADTNSLVVDGSPNSNEFARFTANGLKGKSLTFGIADTNVLLVDGSANDNEFARFTASGLEGRTYAEVLASLSGQAGANFSMNSKKITNVTDPTSNQDASTKKYVDDEIDDGLLTTLNPLVSILDYKWTTTVQNWAITSADDSVGYYKNNIDDQHSGSGQGSISYFQFGSGSTGSDPSYFFHRLTTFFSSPTYDRVIARGTFIFPSSSEKDQAFGVGRSNTVSVFYGTVFDGARFIYTGTDNDDKLYAELSDGTNRETSEITGINFKNYWNDYMIDYNTATTTAKFYINGTLVKTLDTYFSSDNPRVVGFRVGYNGILKVAPTQISTKVNSFPEAT